jgi:hypothetical protein
MGAVFILNLVASLVSCVVVVQARGCKHLFQNVCVRGESIDDLAHLGKFSWEVTCSEALLYQYKPDRKLFSRTEVGYLFMQVQLGGFVETGEVVAEYG